jgi:hypothetical protein
MLQIVIEQSSVDNVTAYLERVKEKIFVNMREAMTESMEQLAEVAVQKMSAAGIVSRTGDLVENILSSPTVTETADAIRGTVAAEGSITLGGRRSKHIGLWMEEGYHVPAVKLADTANRRYYKKYGHAFALKKAFQFSPSGGGAPVWASGHAAFDVRPHPFMNPAIREMKSPIFDLIQQRVAEAYE